MQVMYTDQTSKFPVVASQGNQYIIFLCKIDGNLILVKPLKSRMSGEMCKAHNRLMQWLQDGGIKLMSIQRNGVEYE